VTGPAPIRLGIAGWSYPDWKGIVYPRDCDDELRFVARHVDRIEVNSTFYGVPRARVTQAWVERTRDLAVAFTAKLPQEFTHQGREDDELVLQAREGFLPLVDAGRLAALLAQFSYRFTAGDAALAHLERLRDAFDPLAPLVVELRHVSWRDPQALAGLARLGVSVAHLDYPGMQSAFGGGRIGVFGRAGIAYLRLHGRNSKAWYRKDAGRDEVYDWEYSPRETQQIAERARALATEAAEVIVIANNHFHGKGMKVVLELMALLRASAVPVPAPMLESFPSLRAIAAPDQLTR
jgi:uncharacterized protein YecE (DUF72 family)